MGFQLPLPQLVLAPPDFCSINGVSLNWTSWGNGSSSHYLQGLIHPTRRGPLTTISGFVPSCTHLQPWLNRACWGYNCLITRGAPSCTTPFWPQKKARGTLRKVKAKVSDWPSVAEAFFGATPSGRKWTKKRPNWKRVSKHRVHLMLL